MTNRRGFPWVFGASLVLACTAVPASADRSQSQFLPRNGQPAAQQGGQQRFQFTQPRSLASATYASRAYGGRPISDQDHAKDRSERGQVLPLEILLRNAQRVGQGEYLGVEPNVRDNRYRFKFMRAGGNVVWVDVDARTGEVLSVRP